MGVTIHDPLDPPLLLGHVSFWLSQCRRSIRPNLHKDFAAELCSSIVSVMTLLFADGLQA